MQFNNRKKKQHRIFHKNYHFKINAMLNNSEVYHVLARSCCCEVGSYLFKKD